METQHRSFDLETRSTGNRTVELSFSSETPVDRGDYLEVLSHKPGDVDLSRLNDSHPLLLNHDPSEQIGVVESAKVEGGKGRAVVRFGNSQKAQEVFNDVKDGIRRLVSVGYRILRTISETRDKAGNRVMRFAFQPYEISIVAIPADVSVGVGRSAQITVMNEDYKTNTVNEINAIAKALEGKVDGIQHMAARAIAAGHDVTRFRTECLSQLPEARPVQTSPLIDVKARDWKHYSITRAVAMQLHGERRDGLEAELHAELLRNRGNNMPRPEGILVPDEAFARSHVAGTATLGGFLVQNTVAGDEFIEVLRNKSQVLNLGARVLSLNGPTFIPRQSGTGTANWCAETTGSTLTAINFQNLTLSPRAITSQQQYSRQLLMTSNPSIDGIIRDDMTAGIALAIDSAVLGVGGGDVPVGILGTSGIGTVTAAANGIALATLGATNYAALVSLETAVANGNADVNQMAYLMRSGHRAALKTAQRFASTDSPVFETVMNNGVASGRVNGYRAEVSNQLATNLTTGTATTITSAIYFGDWSSVLVASFGATELIVDEITLAANRVVRLYAHRYADVGIRTPASLAVMGGILTT